MGVHSRGGDRQSEEAKSNVTNVTMVPTQEDHADALGVRRETVNRWEKDRKEMMSDPELAEMSSTLFHSDSTLSLGER